MTEPHAANEKYPTDVEAGGMNAIVALLADATAQLFGVEKTVIFSTSRVARVTEARAALAWALRQRNWSLEEIGEALRRDHTTVIYLLRMIEKRAARNKDIEARLAALAGHSDPCARVVGLARKWAAHDEALAAAIQEWEASRP